MRETTRCSLTKLNQIIERADYIFFNQKRATGSHCLLVLYLVQHQRHLGRGTYKSPRTNKQSSTTIVQLATTQAVATTGY